MTTIKQTLQACAVVGPALLSTGATAQGLPETQIQVIGSAPFSNIYAAVEAPFWTETLPEASGGKVTAVLTAHTESGLGGEEIIRLLGSGALDVAFGDFGSVAGDAALLEGLVLAGIITDFDTLHQASDLYKPVVSEALESHGIKLMALLPFPEFAFFCSGEVTSLEDLAGKKVRVYTPSMSQVIEAVGAVPASIPFGEVIPALQTGVIDCAITGTYSGNRAGWAEVTDSLYTLPIGSGVSFYGYNAQRWDGLDPGLQSFLTEQFEVLEDTAWDVTAHQTEDGVACNLGQDTCQNGKPASMVLHEPTQADIDRVKVIAQDTVLPAWVDDCGAVCAGKWNETIGQLLNLTAGE